MSVLVSFLLTLRTAARSRAELQLEVLALRHLCSANTPHSQVQGHLRRPFKPILVMQSSEDRTRRHAMVDEKMMAIALLVHPFRRRIWNAGSEPGSTAAVPP